MTTAVAPQHTALPSPADRPDADVVVYDGDCSLCLAQVSKLLRWDGASRLAYLSLHDPEVQRRWPDMSRERLMTEMAVVDSRGHKHWGPEAIRYLTRRLPRLWWAAPLAHVPGSMLLWRPLYRWIARNRYRFSRSTCESESCNLHAK